jgi:murein DD-endopeptidase MepM/ murein hydrolase activator NlpD
VSGPLVAPQVTSRIGQIQAQLATLAGGATPPIAGSPGGTTFAAALADATVAPVPPTVPATAATSPATAGGAVSAAWTIPWLAGAEPLAPTAASRAASIGALTRAGAAGDGASVVEPVKGKLTQGFGPTTSVYSPADTVNGVHYAHYHHGIDLAAPLGTPVHAIAAGTVEFAGRYPDGAEVVRIRHADGSVSMVAHLSTDLKVRAGDTVATGQVIGRVGMTGNTTGPHIHFEISVDGTRVDPLPILRAGHLPGATTVAATSTVTLAAAKAASATGSGWTAASPLAAATGSLTDATLAAFDRVATTIPHAAEIRDAAARAGIDPLLLASLVKAESGFRTNAVSSAGALGLCQLMPATAKSMGVTDPFDATQNLRAGARYLAHNLDLYGRTDQALAAYQAGKGAVAQAGGVPDYPVTHTYIDRILGSWGRYREAAA